MKQTPDSGVPAAPEPKDPCELPGFVFSDRYRVTGVLGEGGTAVVLDAFDTTLCREVAIKIIRRSSGMENAADRLRREGQMTVLVDHPNICSVFDNGELPDGRPFLVMERLRGETLHARIDSQGRLSPDETISIMRDVVAALAATHSRGILHRDVKPENIFLVERPGCAPFVKLLDFGMAQALSRGLRASQHHSLTSAGTVVGTPSYLSPEQIAGERNLDGRVDVYACGVTMYEALTGMRPFVEATYGALVRAILTGAAQPMELIVPELPSAIVTLVQRAMAPLPAHRFSSAQELFEAFGAAPGSVLRERTSDRASVAPAAPSASSASSAPSGSSAPEPDDEAVTRTIGMLESLGPEPSDVETTVVMPATRLRGLERGDA